MLLIASKTSRHPRDPATFSEPIAEQSKGPTKVAETQKLLEQCDDMGTRPFFSPYWENAVHKFQRIIAAKLTGAELDLCHAPLSRSTWSGCASDRLRQSLTSA